jgi:hypothetical protein
MVVKLVGHSTQQKQQKTENGSRLLIDARNKALSVGPPMDGC